MTYKSPQEKSGYPRDSRGKSKDRGGSSDGLGPLKGPAKGNRLTDNYPRSKSGNPSKGNSGGRKIEGLDRRGYVKDQGKSAGSVADATVAPDGTRRVRGDKG